MTEAQIGREQGKSPTVADMVGEIFERRSKNYREGGRKLILEMYLDKFAKLVETLPQEKREVNAIKIQKFIVKIGGYFNEYGSRLVDFIRSVALWPMAKATVDFPKDKYYQVGLARAKAWGEFAMNTTKTALNERRAYRNNFLLSALTGAQAGAVVGGLPGVAAGALYGATEGAKIGVLGGGLVGGAIGAGLGGAVGVTVVGGPALFWKIKDPLLGEPAVFYELFASPFRAQLNSLSGPSQIYTSGWQNAL